MGDENKEVTSKSKEVENRTNTSENTEIEAVKTVDNEQTEDKRSEWLSGKFLALLLLVYILFIALGGVIFHFIEHTNEQTTVGNSDDKIQAFLANNTCITSEELTNLIESVIQAYDQGILPITSNETDDSDRTNWDIPSSIFFSTTIVTTIGYGNISPATVGGRVFAVFYAIIGIPLFIVASGQLGMRLSNLSEKAMKRVGKNIQNEKLRPVISLMLVFTIGFSFFSLCAAGIFTAVEGWTYADSLYYTFITLTTIGFGDYYPSFAGGSSGQVGAAFYRLFVSVWIVFGLVWMASTVSAISEAMSKIITKKVNKNTDASE